LCPFALAKASSESWRWRRVKCVNVYGFLLATRRLLQAMRRSATVVLYREKLLVGYFSESSAYGMKLKVFWQAQTVPTHFAVPLCT